MAATAVRVFCAYAPDDADLWVHFEAHLAPLQREGYVTIWHTQMVEAGTERNPVISEHLESAELILLLISPAFINADECYEVVMQRALERQQAGDVQVVPILLRPVLWEITCIAHLQVLPRDAVSVSDRENKDRAFSSIVQELRGIIERLRLSATGRASVGRATARIAHSIYGALSEERPWLVPYRRNPYYTGQESLLVRLHELLRQHAGSGLALSGLGGVGKTQLAVEYAYRYRDEYSAVLWANADSLETLALSYQGLAEKLSLPLGQQAQLRLVVQAVKGWLVNHEDWLLVLDNADFLALPEQATLVRELADFLPVEHKGQVLITTRASTLGTLADCVQVEPLSVEEGALFLLRRAHRLSLDSSLSEVESTEHAAAEAFVLLVDALPLALDQAGAYIDEARCSVADYVERYQTQRKYLLQRRGRYAIDHPEPVATTWMLALQRIEQNNPAAIALLNCCAFLQPDAIPEELFTQGASEMGAALQGLVGNLLAFDEAIEALYAYSLVRREPDTKTFSLHRLVRDVVRDGLDEEQQRAQLECVMKGLNAVFPDPSDVATWPVCQRFVLHVEAALEFFDKLPLVSPEAALLFSRAGGYLREQAHFSSAESLLQRSLSLLEQVYGPGHAAISQALENLSDLYVDVGKYKEAEQLLKRALTINEQIYGAVHAEVARILNGLAAVYRTKGKYKQAEVLLRKAWSIHRRVYGLVHPLTAISLSNLALIYSDQDKYDQAEKFLLEAIDVSKRAFGPSSPDVANGMSNLANIYAYQGKNELAESYYQQVLSIRESAYGSSSLEVARSLNNLAVFYAEQGNYERAEPLLLRSLSINEQLLGLNHPHVADCLSNLAAFYIDQQMYEQAEPLYQCVLSIVKYTFAYEDIHVLRVMDGYVECLRGMKRDAEAATLEAKVRAIRSRLNLV